MGPLRPAHRPCRRAGLLVALALAACATAKPAAVSLNHEMAEMMVAHRAYESAMPLLSQIAAQEPNNARGHLLLGMVLRDKRLFAEARRALSTSWQLCDTDADTAATWGVLLDMEGEGEAADVWHRRSISLGGAAPSHFNNLGFSLYLRGQYTGAIAAYRRALEKDPGYRRVYNNMGFAQARLGMWAEAWTSFQRAGAPGRALSNLALAREMVGDLDQARVFYAEALRVDGKLKVARRNLDNLSLADRPSGDDDAGRPLP